MKKLIIILIAAASFNVASAQSRNDRNQQPDRRQISQTNYNNGYHNQSSSNDYAYHNSKANNDYAYTNKGQNDNRNRQADYDRINGQYDQRINGYRNDRSLSARERDRRINEAQQDRQRSLAGFGTGAVAGGVVGFILGVLVSH